MITAAALIASGIASTQARLFAAPLAAAASQFQINTPARISAFIAQCRVESAQMTTLEEGLFYTTPERIRAIFPSRVKSLHQASLLARNPKGLANTVYADRLGNGDEASGDGWRFRGRGLKQLTGRTNYTAAARGLGRPYVTEPDLVAMPGDACLTAAWYWREAGCNALADSAQWDAITRAVNGPGMLQADLRRQYSEQSLLAFA